VGRGGGGGTEIQRGGIRNKRDKKTVYRRTKMEKKIRRGGKKKAKGVVVGQVCKNLKGGGWKNSARREGKVKGTSNLPYPGTPKGISEGRGEKSGGGKN